MMGVLAEAALAWMMRQSFSNAYFIPVPSSAACQTLSYASACQKEGVCAGHLRAVIVL
jgi:membrane protein YqaA with SNARE-associated domain